MNSSRVGDIDLVANQSGDTLNEVVKGLKKGTPTSFDSYPGQRPGVFTSDTKKRDEKGWYQGQRSPKVTIFCVCKHIVKMLPLTKFQLIWSKIVHFRGK